MFQYLFGAVCACPASAASEHHVGRHGRPQHTTQWRHHFGASRRTIGHFLCAEFGGTVDIRVSIAGRSRNDVKYV